MRGGKNKTGYTITEVLIVLAISSAMFITANVFLSGRVAETNFRTGVNEMASRMQDVIDQVNNGQYNDRPLTCSVVAGAVTTVQATNENQGKNTACIFVGKLFSFSPGGNQYSLDILAGKKLSNDNATISEISPTKVGSISTKYNLPGGIKYISAKNSSGLISSNSFGFIQNPNSSALAGSTNIDSLWTYDGSGYSSENEVSICFVGSNSAKAIINVGLEKNTMIVNTDFINTSSC